MDSKPDTRLQMEKFVKQVGISMQQAYGNVTIQVPELPDLKEEEICNNKDLIEDLINTLVSLLSLSPSKSRGGPRLPRLLRVESRDLEDLVDCDNRPNLNFEI
jgi:hypothetical protein